MVSSLFAGVSGIQQFQQKLDVIGNNIANSNTLGFKSGRADFEDAFSQSLTGGSTQLQIGTGFSQGTVVTTERAEDLAINGNGFFVVRNPVSGNTYATRAGNFTRDREGYLVTSEGYRLQGYTDPSLGALGDIKIDATGNPSGDTTAFKKFSVDSTGKIIVVQESNNSFVRGQVLLQNFSNPGALIKEGNNLFSGLDSAGALTAPAAPGTSGLGEVLGGKLEMSNVDIAGQFADLITTQRGFQASARIITTTDEMLQEVVNLKR
jgi:flagellar hook protein FlgE